MPNANVKPQQSYSARPGNPKPRGKDATEEQKKAAEDARTPEREGPQAASKHKSEIEEFAAAMRFSTR